MLIQKVNKFFFCLIAFLCLNASCFAQGGLGDPVISTNFGSGTALHGPAVPALTGYDFSTADLPPEGSYTIMNNTAPAGDLWWPTKDKTEDSDGYMMVVNTKESGGSVLFKQLANNLCAGTHYLFSAWFLNLLKAGDANPPDIYLRVTTLDGTPLQDLQVGAILPTADSAKWVKRSVEFIAPAGVSQVYVYIDNHSAGGPGINDLAIDDIGVNPYGELLTATFSDNTLSQSACSIEPQPFTVAVTGFIPGNSIQWQRKYNNGSWDNIVGATSDSYSFESPTTPGIYRYRVASADAVKILSYACRIVSGELELKVTEGVFARVRDQQLLYLRGKPPIRLVGSTNSANFHWEVEPGGDDISSLSSTTALNPQASPNMATTYVLKATADAATCGQEAIARVTVLVADDIKPPNTFTPNGDGVNDRWIIGGINTFPDAAIQVFNRNGQLIFRSVGGSASPWDGTYKGKNVPAGNYYYIIDLNIANLKLSGSVAVIR